MPSLFSLCIWMFGVVLPHFQTGAVTSKKALKDLHRHMSQSELEHYFGVSDHTKVPEYEVAAPYPTDERGKLFAKSLFRHDSRRMRRSSHPDTLFYNLHAFGTRLRLRLKKNDKLMAPNLVIETHDREGVVTTQPAPKNKFYIGQVTSDPGSVVAIRSGKGLTGMIKTSRDTLFVQPLPRHLAKHVTTSANTAPHLVYKQSLQDRHEHRCQVKSAKKPLKRFQKLRKRREIKDGYKYLEAGLIVPTTYKDKYEKLGLDYASVLLVTANMVAGMFQDLTMGKTKLYYVVTKIQVVDPPNDPAIKFFSNASNPTKLKALLRWASPYMNPSHPQHFEVFSYVSNKIPVGGLASFATMCNKRGSSGNVNADVGLQTALYIVHETGHTMGLDHDDDLGCAKMTYIMSAILPTGAYAATWSNCSLPVMENFLGGKGSSCLDNSPFDVIPSLPPRYQNQLPGEIFDGDDQCEMQYGIGWRLSPHSPRSCGALNCASQTSELTRNAPVADGTRCGVRHWCMSGRCVDNGLPLIHGGWSSWGSVYSDCTRSCSGGVQFRTRTCTNPVPSNGGDRCRGKTRKWNICNPEECPKGGLLFRHQQCKAVNNASNAYWYNPAPCLLMCSVGSTASSNGAVKDGTRCVRNEETLDVCIQGVCRSVGCDHRLESGMMKDRCGNCGGNGNECVKIVSNYTGSPTVKGPKNATVISRLPPGTKDALFLMRKVTYNYLGIRAESGRYLVGGNLGKGVQTAQAGEAKIIYTHERARFQDKLEIIGTTNVVLYVVYVFLRGDNPGVDYKYMKPFIAGEDKPTDVYEWLVKEWSGCSQTCGIGEKTRVVRCVRSDDKSPASDGACRSKKPNPVEPCSKRDCPSEWHVTHWSICSKSCGNGIQTRDIVCRMKINPIDFVISSKCPADNKPQEDKRSQPCNVIACPADWDTKEGFERDKCGAPLDPTRLLCFRKEATGNRTRVPDLFCRYKVKPTIVPCTTRPTTESATTGTAPREPGGHALSRGNLSKCHMFVAALSLLAAGIFNHIFIG